MNSILEKQKELAKLMDLHLPNEGVHETSIPSLFFIRYSSVSEPAYRVYTPSFCVIAQGSKEVLIAQERYEFGPADYLIASMNLPVVGQIMKASPEV